MDMFTVIRHGSTTISSDDQAFSDCFIACQYAIDMSIDDEHWHVYNSNDELITIAWQQQLFVTTRNKGRIDR